MHSLGDTVSPSHKATFSLHVPPGERCGPSSPERASALPPRSPAAKEGIEGRPLFASSGSTPAPPFPQLNPGRQKPVRPRPPIAAIFPRPGVETESRPCEATVTVHKSSLDAVEHRATFTGDRRTGSSRDSAFASALVVLFSGGSLSGPARACPHGCESIAIRSLADMQAQ